MHVPDPLSTTKFFFGKLSNIGYKFQLVLGGSHFLELAIGYILVGKVGYMLTYTKKKREIKSVLYK
jgi:hypothetical protein